TISATLIAVGQNRPLRFEVASVKPSPQSASRFSSQTCHGTDSKYGPSAPTIPPLGRCIFVRSTLKDAINYAYSLNLSRLQLDPQTKSGQGRPNTDRSDVDAKAEDSSSTKKQLREMLQNLLAERFRLLVDRETKEVPGFALVIAKSGSKLAESKAADGH